MPGWVVVVPVKDLDRAKSRLPGPPRLRAEVALAMAQDTVAAAARCPLVARVVVVTNDARAARLLAANAQVLPDRPRAGLSAAVDDAVTRLCPQPRRPGVVVLTGDLPAAAPAALAAVLGAAAGCPRSFVADTDATGTVLLARTGTAALGAAFGPGSRAAHARSGALDLSRLAAAGLRRDVDTLDDLLAALPLLAPGSRTAVAVARAGWATAGVTVHLGV